MRLRTASASATMALMLAVAGVIGSTAEAVASTSSASTSANDAIAQENTTLVPDLVQQGGLVTADHQWVVMPSGVQVSLVPMALSDCTSGFVCLYANASWTGRLIKSNQPGARIDLSANDFNDVMSS